jgi:hypothetical protein
MLSNDSEKEVFTAIACELQQLVDKRIGSGSLQVGVTQIALGSLEVVITLVTIIGAVHTFFKDYEDLRKGLLLFIEDMKRVGGWLEKCAADAYNQETRKELARLRGLQNRRTLITH